MEKTNNEKLRDLIHNSGLSQRQALLAFNVGLGAAGYSIDSWKSFLVRPDSVKFRPFKNELLVHAVNVFCKTQAK